ncbi:hypothetical protein PAHAL_5G201600 [Panicum hallii]|uniref:Uncharacterized protein n=1 Tax=Panicum hallii TaxID=206008 RepID=A0A2T8IKL7_9POAL|nr:uncharacterized protein LOC112893428 isoform X2 [Panicum hallii]PVH38221.1 hypothetical protein PAHAL_5G201600 [Panicum hallii]
MLGMSNTGASAENTHQFSSKTSGITHNVCQGVECKNVDRVGTPFGSSRMLKNMNLYAANTVVSERFSFHKLSDISVNFRNVLSSDNLSMEWNHFPMFEINRKIDSILNPRRTAFGTSPDKSFVQQKDLKVNMSTSNVMAFSSKEYQFPSHRVADENKSKCRSTGGILSHQDKHIGLKFDQAGKKLKGHLSIEESNFCSKNETDSSCSMTDKLCASNLMNTKEAPCCSSENNFMFSGSRKENENAEGKLLEMKLGALGGCPKQQDFERAADHGLVLGRECGMRQVNASTTSEGSDVGTSGRGMVFGNLLQSEHENLHAHRVNSETKSTESCDLPGKIESTLAMKSKVETLALGKPPKDISTDGKQKGPCLFEMLTLPSKSQGTYFNDPISSGRSCGNMGTCSLGAQKQFATKTDTLYSGTHHASGFASTSTHKDSGCPNTAKSKQIATSSIRGVSSCSGGNETLNVSAGNHRSCLKESCTNKQEWSMPKTSSMNLDLVLFQISRMRNPISSALIESPVCSEPSDRWLKRLQNDILDPHFPCSKRSKIGDGPPPGGSCTIFGQELNFDTGKADMINQAKEVQLRYGRLINQQNLEGSLISAKSLNSWIGRWCQGGTPIYHGTSNVEKQTSKFNMPPDDLGGQFPSIAAMAMMGRAMNKLRPCELQKRGPSVVWKTQGL